MVSFREWLFNLIEAKKDKFKHWRKNTIDFYQGGGIPNHKKSMDIVERAGDSRAERDAIKRMLFAHLVNDQTQGRYKNSFTLMVKPMSAPRPRFTRYGRPYNPKEYTQWKKRVAQMLQGMDTYLFPIELDLEFHFVTKSATWGPHTKKPDVDNLTKAFMDAAQLGGLFQDDCQVYKVTASKFYSYQEMIKVTVTFHDVLN